MSTQIRIPHRVIVKQNTIGPRHDPYSATTIMVTKGNVCATRYTDGLGTELFCISVDGKDVKSRKWNFFDKDKGKYNELFARLIFKKWVGITPEEAMEEYDRDYEPDPMGHPSMYI
ncbi:hypothetical protein [Ralstonia phage RP13]|nr:hypothetical protein [Ralstonia phage RP13]BCG50284.1 hypothetical protein [Ralstonia phage RP13]